MAKLLNININPACAGNTILRMVLRIVLTDQPRMRGEHTDKVEYVDRPNGSTPHARGTPAPNNNPNGLLRINPACAGNTSSAYQCLRACTDQPRMRGEHSAWASTGTSNCGSTPHARGTRISTLFELLQTRINPACAGNTSRQPPGGHKTADQPRMRGEHHQRAPRYALCIGSTPHARGTLE